MYSGKAQVKRLEVMQPRILSIRRLLFLFYYLEEQFKRGTQNPSEYHF